MSELIDPKDYPTYSEGQAEEVLRRMSYAVARHTCSMDELLSAAEELAALSDLGIKPNRIMEVVKQIIYAGSF